VDGEGDKGETSLGNNSAFDAVSSAKEDRADGSALLECFNNGKSGKKMSTGTPSSDCYGWIFR